MLNKYKYGCATSRNKGTCANRQLIKREDVETRVLNGLKTKLLNPAMLSEFVAEYQREWTKLQRENVSERSTHEAELRSVTNKIDNIVDAISNGMFHPSMKLTMDTLEAHKVEHETKLAVAHEEEPILLHPALAQVYGAKITALAESLNDEENKREAIELLRGLVSEVRLHADEHAPGGHHIELFGELAAILELSKPRTTEPRRFTGEASVSLVAGG